jgi:hypothetical protein
MKEGFLCLKAEPVQDFYKVIEIGDFSSWDNLCCLATGANPALIDQACYCEVGGVNGLTESKSLGFEGTKLKLFVTHNAKAVAQSLNIAIADGAHGHLELEIDSYLIFGNDTEANVGEADRRVIGDGKPCGRGYHCSHAGKPKD